VVAVSQPPPLTPYPWMRVPAGDRPTPAGNPRFWWCEMCERYVGFSGQDVCAACGDEET
jgi:hypothetical protein